MELVNNNYRKSQSQNSRLSSGMRLRWRAVDFQQGARSIQKPHTLSSKSSIYSWWRKRRSLDLNQDPVEAVQVGYVVATYTYTFPPAECPRSHFGSPGRDPQGEEYANSECPIISIGNLKQPTR